MSEGNGAQPKGRIVGPAEQEWIAQSKAWEMRSAIAVAGQPAASQPGPLQILVAFANIAIRALDRIEVRIARATGKLNVAPADPPPPRVKGGDGG